MKDATVLIVEDEHLMLTTLDFQIKECGYTTVCATDGSEALRALETDHADLILSDHLMPGIDGMKLLQIVREQYDDLPFIMLTGHGSIEHAVASIQNGADDYLTKPWKVEELRKRMDHILKRHMSCNNRMLDDCLDNVPGFHNIVTRSDAMQNVLKMAAKVAESPDTDVILYGESGTGKELLARAIHSASKYTGKFVGINCAAIPPTLLESELFGHVKGAFTGADRDREGKLGVAQNGTLLLDEIGDMPMELQAKLLRVIEERVYEKIGSDRLSEMNVRIIAATHRELAELVKKGNFREDLFHRINTFPIILPPLKKRKEDILLLAEHFARHLRKDAGSSAPLISQAAADMLLKYQWSGNVRELKNCIKRAIILAGNEPIRLGHLHLNTERKKYVYSLQGPVPGKEEGKNDDDDDDEKIRIELIFDPDDFSLESVDNKVMEIVLKMCGNNKVRAAELLKVNRSKFYRRKLR